MIRKNVPFKPDKTVCDNDGHYIIVAGTLCQYPVILVNVYAPNYDEKDVRKKLSSIPNLHSHYSVLDGDMNPVLDKSNPKTAAPSKMAQTLSQFMNQYGYIDPW